jgi:hypothetical protein
MEEIKMQQAAGSTVFEGRLNVGIYNTNGPLYHRRISAKRVVSEPGGMVWIIDEDDEITGYSANSIETMAISLDVEDEQ